MSDISCVICSLLKHKSILLMFLFQNMFYNNASNLHTFIASSPFNVLAIPVLHPSLLLLGHLHHPL